MTTDQVIARTADRLAATIPDLWRAGYLAGLRAGVALQERRQQPVKPESQPVPVPLALLPLDARTTGPRAA